MRKIAKSALLFIVAFIFSIPLLQGQSHVIVRYDTICPGETGCHKYMDTLFFEDFEGENNTCWSLSHQDSVSGFSVQPEMCWWADKSQCKQALGGKSAFSPDNGSAYQTYDDAYLELFLLYYYYLGSIAEYLGTEYELSWSEFENDVFNPSSIFGYFGYVSISEYLEEDAFNAGFSDIISYLEFCFSDEENTYTYIGPEYMTLSAWISGHYFSIIYSPAIDICDPANTQLSFYYINDEGEVQFATTDPETGDTISYYQSIIRDKISLMYIYNDSITKKDTLNTFWNINCPNCEVGIPETWTKVTLDLPNVNIGTKKGMLNFFHIAEGATGMGIDNILVYGPREICIPAEASTWAGASSHETETVVQRYGCTPTTIRTVWYVLPVTDSIDAEQACETYTWSVNGQIYTESNNTASKTSKDIYGCDSTITLNLTINHVSETTLTVNTCNSYTWNATEETYSSSGKYTDTLKNQYNCDSIITLNLTISESAENITRPRNVCNSFSWSVTSETYIRDTTIEISETDTNGCETTKILELTLGYSSEPSTIQDTACETFTWQEETFTNSTTLSKTLKNKANCDSVVTLELVINHASEPVSVSDVGCESYTWHINGKTYETEGQYTDTIKNKGGCDSIITLNLELKDAITKDTVVDSCDRFFWKALDSIFTSSTTISTTGKSINGCDSTTTLNLTIHYSSKDTVIDASNCDHYTWNGHIFDSTIRYDTTIANRAGCDSNITLNLTIFPSSNDTLEIEACESYRWNVTKKSYTTDTLIRAYLRTEHECDSIVTLKLDITNSINVIDTVIVCDEYRWAINDSLYTETTKDTIHDISVSNCDSNTILLLTIGHATIGDTSSVTVCDTYTWHLDQDSILTVSGFYQDTMHNIFGCDSSVFLQLEVKYSSIGDKETITACDSFYWSATDSVYHLAGAYKGTWTNIDGCDSILDLDLTLNASSPETEVPPVTVCSEYTWLQTGETYSLSGRYSDTLKNKVNCDSVITLVLTSISGAGLNMSNDTTIEICGSASLSAKGAQLYIWEDPDLTLNQTLFIDTVARLIATPRTTTQYYVTGYYIGENLINNGNFSQGDYGFQTELVYDKFVAKHGSYRVANYAFGINSNFSGKDHTTPNLNTGLFMIIDGATNNNVITWTETVEVKPNTNYLFSMWGTPLTTNSSTAQLQVYINGVMTGEQFDLRTTANNQGNWTSHYFVWNSGDATSATIKILNRNISEDGNNYGIDDISFVELNCSVEDSVLVKVNIDTADIFSCDAYTWSESSITYTEDGIYTKHYTTAVGCDSMRVLALTIGSTHIDTIPMTACARYFWSIDSNMYEESGIYSWSTNHPTADSTCDTIYRLKLTILDCGEIPLPDNIIDPECGGINDADVDLVKHVSGNGVNSMSTPLVGDVDGDGEVEILACAFNGDPSKGNKILVFNSKTGAIKYTINTVNYNTSGQLMSIADIDGDGNAELFLLGDRNYLFCYSALGMGQKWRSRDPLDARYTVMTADVNADGLAEVICGPYLFDAQTGTLLLHGTLEEEGKGYAAPKGTTGYGLPYYMQGMADIDFDGYLELCAGNSIYKPLINSSSTGTGNSWSLLRQANKIDEISSYDGQTFLSDFDGDGDVDVCVVGFTPDSSAIDLYVWEGQSSAIVGYYKIPLADDADKQRTPTMPTCADIDGNGTPEIVFSHLSTLYAFSYDEAAEGHIKMVVNNTELGEASGITAFDFNQDGTDELIFRGNKQLIVLRQGDENVWTPTTAYSGLMTEYAVVADVDNDGHAEVIVNQANTEWNGNAESAEGRMVVYKGKNTSNIWGSARRVWNQWTYNSVNINENLMVPNQLLDIATTFPNGKEPFNAYQRQMSLVDQQGNAYTLVPDVNTTGEDIDISYGKYSVNITMTYGNMGSNTLYPPYSIAVYADSLAEETSVWTTEIEDTLYKGKRTKEILEIPLDKLCHISIDSLIIVINGDHSGIAQYSDSAHQAECDTTNNTFKIAFDSIVPKADTTFVAACDSYYWDALAIEYHETDTVSDTIVDMQGCDSVRWLYVSISHSFDSVLDTIGCDLFLWTVTRDTFTADTQIVAAFKTIYGCDSIYSLTLEMHNNYDTTQTNEVCDGYLWDVNGRTYTFSGHMTDSAKTIYGCDSVHHLLLTVFPTIRDSVYDTICNGTTREFGGQFLGETGHYIYTISRETLCDSTHELFLHVVPALPIELKWTAQCDQQQYTLIAYNPIGKLRTPPTWESFPSDPEVAKQNGHDTILIHPTLSTIYTATIVYDDTMACPTKASIRLEPPHSVKARIGLSTSCLSPDLLDFRATALGEDFPYQTWTIEGEYYSDRKTIDYHFDQLSEFDSVTISLKVSNDFCADSQTVVIPYLIAELNAPNIFSPSDDRFKYFKVRGKGIIEYEIHIFNRQGLQVFHSQQLGDYWDGTHEGKKVPQGAYVYYITYRTVIAPKEVKHKTGTVLLVR